MKALASSGDLQAHVTVFKPVFKSLERQADYIHDLALGQRAEQDYIVYPVEELRAK